MPAESGHTSRTRMEAFSTSSFTGKERDQETGYGYFGARYMDHELMTMWLSVDPMADKYPGISPYAYCAWNPVKLVDPEGKDVWTLSDDGTMTWEKASKHDVIKYKGSKIILQNSNNVFGTKPEGCSFLLNEKVYTFTDVMDAQKTFEFFADNLNFEFSALGYVENGKKKYDLTTSLSDRGDTKGSERAMELGDKLLKHFHNHPDGNITPSTPNNRVGDGDDQSFSDSIREKSKSCSFYLYTKSYGGAYFKYFSENGEMKVNGERKSSFIKTSKNYTRNYGVLNAFSF